jgi:hypothetical protein
MPYAVCCAYRKLIRAHPVQARRGYVCPTFNKWESACHPYTRATRGSYPPIGFPAAASHVGCEKRHVLAAEPSHELNSPSELPVARLFDFLAGRILLLATLMRQTMYREKHITLHGGGNLDTCASKFTTLPP